MNNNNNKNKQQTTTANIKQKRENFMNEYLKLRMKDEKQNKT